jgi:poly(3-hydroxybutyrate) depolymerase
MTVAGGARCGCVVVACVLAVAAAARAAPSAPSRGLPFHIRSLRFVDGSRTIRLADGRRVPRLVETVVRYPVGEPHRPLIVFGHGFALAPATYDRLLDAWAGAGYVVAAPVFPLENANAPGGPVRSDLVDEPRDVSIVITRLLALSARTHGVLAGRIDPARIAVAGHSDGGAVALAVAYDRRFRDVRVGAAIVLSGAPLAGMGPFPVRGPPLLAIQGTADPFNAATTTASFFRLAHRPKFVLWLLGATHRTPYTVQQPQLGIVERATLAFLGHYLSGRPLAAFEHAARRPLLTRLSGEP